MKRILIALLTFHIYLYAGLSAFAQSKSGTLKGLVKTSDGEPAAYVNIGLIGTNKITGSDAEGKYEIINIKPGMFFIVYFINRLLYAYLTDHLYYQAQMICRHS